MYETVWTFATKNYSISLMVAPEDIPAKDSFQFQEDIDAVNNGDVVYFTAKVAVHKNGYEIGTDYLGCCAYSDVEEFYTGHRDADPMNRNSSIMQNAKGGNVIICHYFPDMVRQAIADARTTLTRD